MKKQNAIKLLSGILLTGALGAASVHSAEVTGIVGKNDWLFYQLELLNPTELAKTSESIALIGRLNKVLAANGISMAVTVVPLKMRIYAEQLPDNVKLNDYMVGNYERINKSLQSMGVMAIDLNQPFLSSPKRNSDTPLFFRLDSHWNPTGAMLAAETIRAGVDANAALKKALEVSPLVEYKMSVGKRKLLSKGTNLVDAVPPKSGPFAPEYLPLVSVTRAQAPIDDKRASAGIAVVGSSYSMDWTGFVDGLRFTLQRDIVNASVTGDKGFWFGMESYLRSDAFQDKAPKMLIWEMSEFVLRVPPDTHNDPRYASNNTEWLLRTSALVQATCKPSAVTARVMPIGLAANAANLKGGDVATGPTNDNEFIEISFDKPIERMDYLAARATAVGSKSVVLEGSGPGVATRRFTMELAGDDALHALKTPLPSNGSGFTKVRIYPGKSTSFAVQGLKVCRQPDDLLK